MRYYQPSEGHLDLCLLAHKLFRTRPADLPAASLRLATAYYEKLGQPEPVTPAHPGYYCAMHALSAWDRVVVQQLRPAAVKRVRELQLGYVPTEPAPMLRAPWMIEVKRGGDDTDRLFGNTIALCGVHLMPIDMWLLTGWRREGSREFFTVGKWPVTWGADDLGISDVEEVSARCVDGVWVKSTDTDSTVFGGTDWLSQAVQFAINLGELTAAENAPLRVDEERTEHRSAGSSSSRQTGGRKSPPDLRWVVRHVYLDEPSRPSLPSATAGTREPLDTTDRQLAKVEVRAHMRRQRFGPGNTQTKRIYIDPFEARRWTSGRPVKVVIDTKRGKK